MKIFGQIKNGKPLSDVLNVWQIQINQQHGM